MSRPASDQIKRKPSKEARRARREREDRQSLARAQRYLKATLIERGEVDLMISTGKTHDPEGRRLDYRLNNLTNREAGLRAAIERLTGVLDKEIPQQNPRAGSYADFVGTNSSLAQPNSTSETTYTRASDEDEEFGVPLPSEKQKLEGLIYNTRDGQDRFRDQILAAYGCCALTGCRDIAVLQAAHIIPYVNAASNVLRNGLCLRADVHLLFDRGLVRITRDYRALVHPELKSVEYQGFADRKIRLPSDRALWPDPLLLASRHKYILTYCYYSEWV